MKAAVKQRLAEYAANGGAVAQLIDDSPETPREQKDSGDKVEPLDNAV